jgi:hypothetical protein
MKPRHRLTLALLLTCATGLPARSSAPDAATRAFTDATDAWARGDYISALGGYTEILNGAGGDVFLDRIALQTGELFVTHELTADGRAPRFSPDGRFIVYETGLEVSRATRIVRNDATRALVAELPGASATFTADSSKVAYIRIPATADVAAAAQALERAELTAYNRNYLIQNLTWLIARDAPIVVRDLNTQREVEIPAPGLLKTGLAYAPDGSAIYFLGARESDQTRTDIYSVAVGGQPAIAADAPGLKSVPTVASTGAALIYTVPTVNPVRRPVAPSPPGTPPPAPAPAPAAPAPPPPPTFGVVDLATRSVRTVTGRAPTLSDDGTVLAYVTSSDDESTLMAGPVLGTAAAVKKINGRLDAPALSPDGSRVAYQRMDRHDWEIFVAKADGTDEQRLTRDIQHDVLPRFVAGGARLLWVVGEPRHRRAFVLDLAAPAGTAPTRLFHNNTVRTIAPEYQWSVSPDGALVLIGSERDGDTVSPPRGVYLVDTRQKVSKSDLLARLKAGLDGETALKANGERLFKPIAEKVRQAVGSVSTARIYGYEKALYDFDSKHITRPGNRQASEYLFKTYESFGYTPEYQWFEPANALGGNTANVVATLRGTVNPELVYVISSHYDSVAAGPGADDNSSGTTALLEAARVLADHPMPATIVFASMTGEESGLLGSREFVRRSFADKMNVVGALNNDMIGWSNDQRLDNTIRYSNPGIRDIQHGAAMLFTNLITYDALYWKGTDAMSYYDTYGDIVGGIGSYPVLSSPFYHQPTDVLENINHEQVAETSKTTVATIMLLASSPSRLKDITVRRTNAAASVTWAPSPEKGVGSYIVAYGPKADPYRRRLTVTEPRASLDGVAEGDVVSVKGVNGQGLEGWSWASAVVP